MGAIALPEELLPLLLAHRVEHHFFTIFITCSRKQVTTRRRSSGFSIRDLLSSSSFSSSSSSFADWICILRTYAFLRRHSIFLCRSIPLVSLVHQLGSLILHSLGRSQFTTIDHHRGRTRRQLVASIPNPLCRSGLLRLGGIVNLFRRASCDHAEDDRPTGSDRVAVRSASGRGGGSIDDRADRRTRPAR